MRKLSVITCVILLFLLPWAGCTTADTEPVTAHDPPTPTTREPQETENGEEDMIELGVTQVMIPSGHEGEGGHDGVQFHDAVIRPVQGELDYEITVSTASSYSKTPLDEQMERHSQQYGAPMHSVDTEDWVSPDVSAYTGLTIMDGVETQVLVLFSTFEDGATGYTTLYMTMEESIEYHPDILVEFAANQVITTWHD